MQNMKKKKKFLQEMELFLLRIITKVSDIYGLFIYFFKINI